MKHLLKSYLIVVVIAATSIYGQSGAAAHSFKAGLLLPFSGPSARAGKQILDGFMLATKERDAHPDTESDGHLGGLDVYISRIDSAGVSKSAVQKAGALLRREKIEFLVVFTSSEVLSALYPVAAGRKVFIIGLSNGPQKIVGKTCHPYFISISRRNEPGVDQALTANFKKEYGHVPSRVAALGYDSARLIGSAVRALGGELGNREALLRALRESTYRPIRSAFDIASGSACK